MVKKIDIFTPLRCSAFFLIKKGHIQEEFTHVTFLHHTQLQPTTGLKKYEKESSYDIILKNRKTSMILKQK